MTFIRKYFVLSQKKQVTLKTNLTRKTTISNWHFSHDLYLKEQNYIENYLLLFLTPLIVGRFVQSCEDGEKKCFNVITP